MNEPELDVPAPAATRRTTPRWTSGSVLVPLVVFFAARLVDVVLIVVISAHGGHRDPGSQSYVDVVTSADGHFFRQIALHGYPTTLPTDHGSVTGNPWAFYPLYPGLVRAVMVVTRLPFAGAAQLVTLACGALAFVLVFGYVERRGGRMAAVSTTLALSTFPAAPVLQAAYSEGLCLLVVAAVLVSLERRAYRWTLLWLVVLSLTRPLVICFAPVLALGYLLRRRAAPETPFPPRERRWLLALLATSLVSFAIWPLTCAVVTGRLDGYVETERNWYGHGPNTEASWLARAVHDPGAAIVLVVLAAAAAAALVSRQARRWPSDVRVFASAVFAYLTVTTRPSSSIFRLAMVAIVPWWPLPAVGAREGLGVRVTVVVTIVVIGLASQALWIHLYLIGRPGVVGSDNFP